MASNETLYDAFLSRGELERKHRESIQRGRELLATLVGLRRECETNAYEFPRVMMLAREYDAVYAPGRNTISEEDVGELRRSVKDLTTTESASPALARRGEEEEEEAKAFGEQYEIRLKELLNLISNASTRERELVDQLNRSRAAAEHARQLREALEQVVSVRERCKADAEAWESARRELLTRELPSLKRTISANLERLSQNYEGGGRASRPSPVAEEEDEIQRMFFNNNNNNNV